MNNMYRDNPNFVKQGEFKGGVRGDSPSISVYTCAKDTEYHTVRYIEALNWTALAACGITKDKLGVLTDKMLELCNDTKSSKTFRTDITSIAQLIKYAMKYPIDEHCGVQLGCMLSFIEYDVNETTYSEAPDKVEDLYMSKKMELALNDPEAYSFFLSWGVANIPEYKTQFDISISTDYFERRRQAMTAILPDSLKHLMTN